MPGEAKTCARCGGKVPHDSAEERRIKFGVIFCTDCKSDKHWITKMTLKG